MIVAQLIETLGAGGAEGLAVQIANSLARRGHDSHLIVLSEAGPFRSRLSPTVHFHDLGLPASSGSSLRRSPAFFQALRKLGKLISAHRIEALQTHLPLANFFGLVMGWRGSCRVYPTVHNNREFDYGDASGPVRESLRRFAYRQMLVWCRGMIAVSDQVKNAMAGELDLPVTWLDRITVVPNGVPVPAPMTAGERLQARAAWRVGGNETLIVGIGRLTAQKNFHDLVDSLALMDRAGGAWRCVVAGDGELREDLVALSRTKGLDGRIEFAGHVAEVGELLGAADIFCLPSRFEGLPLVLLEAMARSLPVAAYRIDGVTDVVEDGVQALLAEPGNPVALAGALERLVGDEKLRSQLGRSGRDLVLGRYDFPRVVDKLEEVYAV